MNLEHPNKHIYQHWGKDLQLALYIVFCLFLFRLLMLWIFNDRINMDGNSDLSLALLTGLRFDLSVAGIWVLPSVLFGSLFLLLHKPHYTLKLRNALAKIFAVVSIPLLAADVVYFIEYGDHFDQRIFALFYDDTQAILITLWKEYHPVAFLAVTLIIGTLQWFLLKAWINYTPAFSESIKHQLHTPPRRYAGGLLLFLLLASSARGGLPWGEPVQLKHAFVSNDNTLNRVVIDPFTALYTAIENKVKLESSIALKELWPSQDLHDALQVVRSYRGQDEYQGNNIDEGLTIQTSGHQTKPRHIFLLILESHSGWTVMPEHRALGFSPNLSELAQAGIYFPNFVPISSGTIGTINTLISGLPDVHLNTNYANSASEPYATGLATQMHKQGYTTRFYYGGLLGWQRLDRFVKDQGFDEVYGGGQMNAGTDINEWGVDDEYLFRFVEQTVNDDQPSFNVIMTTSNHAPFDLDLDAIGYPYKELPETLKATRPETLKVLGHLWYTDQQAGKFVKQTESKLEKPLYVITGDHTARLAIQFEKDTTLKHSAVPLILYGPAVLARTGQAPAVGSMLDVPATLINLVADKNFNFSSFGRDLLAKPRQEVAMGWRSLLKNRELLNTKRLEKTKVYGNDGESLKVAMKYYKALQALAWYRIKRGNILN